MRRRCYEPSNNRYQFYGAKGITVCDRWRNSFRAFVDDMGPKPTPKHSIERIDLSGNYCKENCKWADPVEQGNNKTINVYVVVDGQRMTKAQAARSLGLVYKSFHHCLERFGGDVSRAAIFATKIGGKPKRWTKKAMIREGLS